MMNYTSEGQV